MFSYLGGLRISRAELSEQPPRASEPLRCARLFFRNKTQGILSRGFAPNPARGCAARKCMDKRLRASRSVFSQNRPPFSPFESDLNIDEHWPEGTSRDCIYPCIIKKRGTRGKNSSIHRALSPFGATEKAKGKGQNHHLPSYRDGRSSAGMLRSASETTFRAHSSVLGCLRATSGDAETIARVTSSWSYPSISNAFATLKSI